MVMKMRSRIHQVYDLMKEGDGDSAGDDDGVTGEEDDDDAQGVRPDEGGRVEGCVQRVPRGGRVQGDTSSLGSAVTG